MIMRFACVLFSVCCGVLWAEIYEAFDKDSTDKNGKSITKDHPRIKTKISGTPFDLTLQSLHSTTREYIPSTQEIDVRIVTKQGGECQSWGETLNEGGWRKASIQGKTTVTLSNITVHHSSKEAVVQFRNSDESNQTILGCSSDSFAIRPDRFTLDITSSCKDLYIYRDIHMTASTQSSHETNTSYEGMQEQNYILSIQGAKKEAFTFSNANTFASNLLDFSAKFTENGDFNLSLSEKNNEFAIIDRDDTPDSERYITPALKELTIGRALAPEIWTNIEQVSLKNNQPIAPNLTLTAPADKNLNNFILNGSRVDISDYDSTLENEKLSAPNKEGFKITFDAKKGTLSIEGSKSLAAYQEVFRSVIYEYNGTNPQNLNKEIVFSIGEAFVCPATGHFYKYEKDPNIRWDEARKKAESIEKRYFGLQGYLPTVTSQAEMECIRDKLDQRGWLGASDEAKEGIWRWVTGPEGLEDGGKGQHFFTQTRGIRNTDNAYGKGYKIGGGKPVKEVNGSDRYNHWDKGTHEPNDVRYSKCEDCQEHYGHFYDKKGLDEKEDTEDDGAWNDYKIDHEIEGYVIEFGGMDCDPEIQLTSSLKITKKPRIFLLEQGGSCGDSDKMIFTQVADSTQPEELTLAVCDGSTPVKITGEFEIFIDSDALNDTDGTHVKTVSLNNESKKNFTLTYPKKAIQEAYIKVREKKSDGLFKSLNRFSIRPAHLDVKVAPPYQNNIAAQHYSEKLKITSSVDGYTNVNVNTLSIKPIKYKKLGSNSFELNALLPGTLFHVASTSTPIIQGTIPGYADLNYSEVGRIDINVTDTQWTQYDQANGLCIPNSASNVPDAQGKVGCEIAGSIDSNLTYIPYKFDLTYQNLPKLTNHGNNLFTYLSSNVNVGATLTELNITLKAMNVANKITRNYDDSVGYDKDINLSVNLLIEGYTPLVENSANLRFYDKDLNFFRGEANVTSSTVPSFNNIIRFNFPRDSKIPQETFTLDTNSIDINISTEANDSDQVRGERNQSLNEGNATFVYGRINPTDAKSSGNSADLNVYYELYTKTTAGRKRLCKALNQPENCTKAGGMVRMSHNDIFWWRTPGHPSTIALESVNFTFDSAHVSSITPKLFVGGRNPQEITVSKQSNFVGTTKIDLDLNAATNNLTYLFYNRHREDNISHAKITFSTQSTPSTDKNVTQNPSSDIGTGSRSGW
jgi:hypothetical protein